MTEIPDDIVVSKYSWILMFCPDFIRVQDGLYSFKRGYDSTFKSGHFFLGYPRRMDKSMFLHGFNHGKTWIYPSDVGTPKKSVHF
jgi:hypothetical protein